MLCKTYSHILGHVDTCPARSYRTYTQSRSHQTAGFLHSVENHHQASILHQCEYRVWLDCGVSERRLPSLETHCSVSGTIHSRDTALDSWKQNRFTDSTEASLTKTITNSGHPNHRALVNRALVRAHLRHCDVAIDGAEEVSLRLLSLPTHLYSLSIDPSPSLFNHPSLATSQRV